MTLDSNICSLFGAAQLQIFRKLCKPYWKSTEVSRVAFRSVNSSSLTHYSVDDSGIYLGQGKKQIKKK